MNPGRPSRSEWAANEALSASAARIGPHALISSRRPVTRVPGHSEARQGRIVRALRALFVRLTVHKPLKG